MTFGIHLEAFSQNFQRHGKVSRQREPQRQIPKVAGGKKKDSGKWSGLAEESGKVQAVSN